MRNPRDPTLHPTAMIKIYLYTSYSDGTTPDPCADETMWVQQEGYEGAWVSDTDKRFKLLKPVLDLLEPNNEDAFLWDEFKSYVISVSEWDSITDNALLP